MLLGLPPPGKGSGIVYSHYCTTESVKKAELRKSFFDTAQKSGAEFMRTAKAEKFSKKTVDRCERQAL